MPNSKGRKPTSRYGSQIKKIKTNPPKPQGGGKGGKGGDRPKGNKPPKIDPMAPMTYGQIQQAAHNAGQVAYGDVQNQLTQQQANIVPWFDQYRAAVTQQQQALPAQYQPVLQQAQGTAQATGQGVLQGVDPGSEAAQNDALAAASRKVLADQFVNLIGSQQNATQDYYGGRISAANAGQQQALTTNAQAQRDVAGQRGAYEAQQIQQGIGQERDYGIAAQHQAAENAAFGLDQYEAQQKAKNDRARIRATNRKNRQSQRDRDEDQALAGKKFDSEQEKDAYQRKHHLGPYKRPAKPGPGGLTPAQQRAEKERIGKVRQKSKEALSRIRDARNDWESLVGSKVTTGKKDKDGNELTRPITPKDIRSELRKRGFSSDEIHLMLMIRAGKKFGPDEIEMAHALGMRIPRKYLPSNNRPSKPGVPTGGAQTAPSKPGSNQQRPT